MVDFEISDELLRRYSKPTSDPNVTYVDFRAIIDELEKDKRKKQYTDISHLAYHLEPDAE
jgi:hypothetical protein